MAVRDYYEILGLTKSASADEIRTMLREELAQRVTAAPTAAVDEPDAEPTPQSTELQGLVDRALASGRWTQGDRAAALALFPALRPDERRTISRLVYTAVNAGRLRVESEGPPF